MLNHHNHKKIEGLFQKIAKFIKDFQNKSKIYNKLQKKSQEVAKFVNKIEKLQFRQKIIRNAKSLQTQKNQQNCVLWPPLVQKNRKLYVITVIKEMKYEVEDN